MRIYYNVREAYSEAKRDLKEMGVCYISESVQDQVGEWETYELYAYAYKILDTADAMTMIEEEGLNVDWANAESVHRTDHGNPDKNPGPAWTHNSEFWGQFLHDGVRDPEFSYTYAERIHPQINKVIRELRAKPETRQAVITMYDQHQDIDNFGGKARIPCSMHYQFLIRNNRLHVIYCMRSCDLLKFLLYDIFFARSLQYYILGRLPTKTKPGTMTHLIGSLHAFKQDLIHVY